MDIKGKKVAVLLERQYHTLEFWYPLIRMREAGAEVLVVGPEAEKSYTSKVGYPAKSEKAAKDINVDEIDAVIIPGGWAPDYLRRTPAIVDLVKKAIDKGKVVAAICHGGWLLCSTGLLKGRKLTSFSSIKDDMENAGAIWIDEPCVIDKNLITSRTPDDLPYFARAIVSSLSGSQE